MLLEERRHGKFLVGPARLAASRSALSTSSASREGSAHDRSSGFHPTRASPAVLFNFGKRSRGRPWGPCMRTTGLRPASPSPIRGRAVTLPPTAATRGSRSWPGILPTPDRPGSRRRGERGRRAAGELWPRGGQGAERQRGAALHPRAARRAGEPPRRPGGERVGAHLRGQPFSPSLELPMVGRLGVPRYHGARWSRRSRGPLTAAIVGRTRS